MSGSCLSQNSRSVVRIVKVGERYQLEVNGREFPVKGAVGKMHLEKLVEAGGNSIRAGIEDLDRAHSLGLMVLAGLPFGKPRWGFDYTNEKQVEEQLQSVLQIVRSYKNHPALLMWAIGNELEINTTPEQRVPLWRAVNQAAEAIKEEDGKHPVITPIGDQYRFMLHELDEYCPALDAVGLNSYVDMLTLPEDVVRNGWTRPYVVTEFGPRGHWQVEKTPWGMPIEDTSTEKAEFYLKAYHHAVEGRPQCIGAFAFHWANHHEKTHTWYGMFLPDGSPTGAVDVMTYLWTGKWPANRCPRIGQGRITVEDHSGKRIKGPAILRSGTRIRCTVDADDPDGDPLTIKWDLRVDVADNPNVGGDREDPVPPIEGAVVWASGMEAVIQLPQESGKYRLFVYVYDDKGSAATANVPLLVEP
jgi:hypothetical protein